MRFGLGKISQQPIYTGLGVLRFHQQTPSEFAHLFGAITEEY